MFLRKTNPEKRKVAAAAIQSSRWKSGSLASWDSGVCEGGVLEEKKEKIAFIRLLLTVDNPVKLDT